MWCRGSPIVRDSTKPLTCRPLRRAGCIELASRSSCWTCRNSRRSMMRWRPSSAYLPATRNAGSSATTPAPAPGLVSTRSTPSPSNSPAANAGAWRPTATPSSPPRAGPCSTGRCHRRSPSPATSSCRPPCPTTPPSSLKGRRPPRPRYSQIGMNGEAIASTMPVSGSTTASSTTSPPIDACTRSNPNTSKNSALNETS